MRGMYFSTNLILVNAVNHLFLVITNRDFYCMVTSLAGVTALIRSNLMVTHTNQFSKIEKQRLDLEVVNMLKKGTIRIAISKEDQCWAIFSYVQKGRGIQANYKPKKAESICTLPTFQNGGSTRRKEYAQQRGPHVKLHLRCLFFPLSTESRKLVRFRWKGKLRVSVPSFQTSRIFTKLLKVPISILRRLNTRLIIYSKDLLLMGVELPGNLLGTGHNYFPFSAGRSLSETPDKIGIFWDTYQGRIQKKNWQWIIWKFNRYILCNALARG